MPSVIALDSIMFRLLSKARKIDYPPDLDLKGRVALALQKFMETGLRNTLCSTRST